VGDREIVVDAGLEHRAGHVELRVRQGADCAIRTGFRQGCGHWKTEVLGESDGTADGHDCAAFFHEAAKGRYGLGGGDAANLVAILVGHGVGCEVYAESTTAATSAFGGDAAVGEDQDVEFTLEIASVEGRRVNEFVGHGVSLLEHPADVTGFHRAAVAIPEADS